MLTINPATPKDITDLLKMMRALCAFHGDRCLMGLAQAQQKFINDGQLMALVARQGGSAAGYAVIEPKWAPTRPADTHDIAHLYVVEHLRGRGIGRQLIDAAKAAALHQGASQLTIGTSPDNPAAATAYRAMGLAEITKTSGARFCVPLK